MKNAPQRMDLSKLDLDLMVPPERREDSIPQQIDIWDTDVTGFGLRFSSTRAASWVLLLRINTERGQKVTRVTLGSYNELDVESARAMAEATKSRLGISNKVQRRAAQIRRLEREAVPATNNSVKGTALYRWFDAEGSLLYVGISVTVLQRVSQHSRDSRWFCRAASMTVTWFGNRAEAESAERNAIKTEFPSHNRAHAHPRMVSA